MTRETGDAANPNAESEQGLAGEMGVSSERTEFEGIENTGTLGSAQGRTHGAEEEHEIVAPDGIEHHQTQDVEENPAKLRSHEEIRAANPHPRRDEG